MTGQPPDWAQACERARAVLADVGPSALRERVEAAERWMFLPGALLALARYELTIDDNVFASTNLFPVHHSTSIARNGATPVDEPRIAVERDDNWVTIAATVGGYDVAWRVALLAHPSTAIPPGEARRS